MGGEILFLLFFLSLIFILLCAGMNELNKKKEKLMKDNGITGDCYVGSYLFDLPGAVETKKGIFFGKSGDSIVFFTYDRVLGTIECKNIIKIFVDDKSQVFKTVSGGVAILGAYTAETKKSTETRFILVIHWKDERKIEYNTSFEFKGPQAKSQVQKALDQMKDYLPKQRESKPQAMSKGLGPTISPDDYLKKAEQLLESNSYDEAIAACTALLRFLPQHSAALYMRALGYHHQGKIQEALADAKEASALGDVRARKYIADFHPNLFAALAGEGKD